MATGREGTSAVVFPVSAKEPEDLIESGKEAENDMEGKPVTPVAARDRRKPRRKWVA